MAFAWPSLASLAVTAQVGSKELGQATAFVAVADGNPYLVTNWHVVTGRHPGTGQVISTTGGMPDRLLVLHQVTGEIGRWEWESHDLYDQNNDPLWLEHPTHGRDVDVVALPLEGLTLEPFHYYDLSQPGPRISFSTSNVVSIIGFPFALDGLAGLGVWVQGSIATEPDLDYDDLPLFLVDSRTRPGQSGSPVILYRTDGYMTEGGDTINNGVAAARLLGVYSGRINEESDLGLVWKLSALAEIIEAQQRGPLPGLKA